MFTNRLKLLRPFGEQLNAVAECVDVPGLKEDVQQVAMLCLSPQGVTDQFMAKLIYELAGAQSAARNDEAMAWFPPIDEPTLLACVKNRCAMTTAYRLACVIRDELQWQERVKKLTWLALPVLALMLLLGGIYSSRTEFLFELAVATLAICTGWIFSSNHNSQMAEPKEDLISSFEQLQRMGGVSAAQAA